MRGLEISAEEGGSCGGGWGRSRVWGERSARGWGLSAAVEKLLQLQGKCYLN